MNEKLFRFTLSCVVGAFLLTTLQAQVPETPLTVTYTYSGYPLPIPIDSSNVAALLHVVVPRSLTITKVTASVQVNYSNVGDLNVYLYSPLRTRARLLERNCGGLVNIDSSFDDAAESSYSDFCPSEAGRGSFRPNEPLSNFNDQNSLGTWTLAVENNGSDSRFGSVVGFSITITGTAQAKVAVAPGGIRSTANPLATDQPIAPGQFISVLGYNLGPQLSISTGETYWPTWIDGTVVRINGQDAPMRFISFYRIDVQVPVELDLSQNAKVSVFRNGVSSNEVEVAVDATNPAVVTTSMIGAGQAQAVNADGKANGSDNLAATGSVITVHATGLGVTDPLFGAGEPVPQGIELRTVAPVTATIGGVDAKVVRAIAAPGLVSIYAVDIQVPALIKEGPAEIYLHAGGRSSQGGAIIHVK